VCGWLANNGRKKSKAHGGSTSALAPVANLVLSRSRTKSKSKSQPSLPPNASASCGHQGLAESKSNSALSVQG